MYFVIQTSFCTWESLLILISIITWSLNSSVEAVCTRSSMKITSNLKMSVFRKLPSKSQPHYTICIRKEFCIVMLKALMFLLLIIGRLKFAISVLLGTESGTVSMRLKARSAHHIGWPQKLYEEKSTKKRQTSTHSELSCGKWSRLNFRSKDAQSRKSRELLDIIVKNLKCQKAVIANYGR